MSTKTTYAREYHGYIVFSDGQVWSKKFNRFMKPHKLLNGYLQVTLRINGKYKHFYIHRLVATLFVSNPKKLKIVNHKDENKLNNEMYNLEWCDFIYNNNYGKMKDHFKGVKNPNSKLTKEDVMNIRNECVPFSRTHGARALAKKYNVTPDTITNITKGHRWGWLK